MNMFYLNDTSGQSARKASIGRTRAALTAGMSPATVPASTMSMVAWMQTSRPTVGLGTCIGATIAIVIAGTIAGLIPAIKAARIRPIDALRAE